MCEKWLRYSAVCGDTAINMLHCGVMEALFCSARIAMCRAHVKIVKWSRPLGTEANGRKPSTTGLNLLRQ